MFYLEVFVQTVVAVSSVVRGQAPARARPVRASCVLEGPAVAIERLFHATDVDPGQPHGTGLARFL